MGKNLLLFCVVLSPLGGKLPGLPVSVAELCLACAVCFFVPSVIKDIRGGRWYIRLKFQFLLLMALALAMGYSVDLLAAVREGLQLCLYLIGGVWVYSIAAESREWRSGLQWACALGSAVGLLGILAYLLGFQSFFERSYAFPVPTACCTALLGLIAVGMRFAQGRIAPYGMATVCCVLLSAQSIAGAEDNLDEQVPERYREAYAAVSVLSDHPLFGVGPGNYQMRIGEYFQGMPKDNSIEPGTRVGFAVLIASLGMVGFTAFICWWSGLWYGIDASLRPVLLLFLFCGLLTPLFVGQLLFPIVLLHGFATSEERAKHV